MFMKLDQDQIKGVVSNVLQGRKALRVKLDDAQDRLRLSLDQARKVRGHIKSFQDGMESLLAQDPLIADMAAGFVGFMDAVDEVAAKCAKGQVRLRCTQEHFNRDSFCVASAGGSQAGKSTTLQKIVGFDETDPKCPVVGGGTGNSTTATRCRIVNIGSEGESYARVEFYGAEEFFTRIVSPYVESLKAGLPLPTMTTIEDFLDFKKENFESRHPESLTLLDGREQLKKYYVRFCALRQAYGEYRDLLDEPSRNVPLEKAYEYLVYPSAKPQYNSLKALCHAVKEVTLFCRYPNPVVDQIEFFDLPGAGEVAPDVERRYAEGFDLKTDTVVYVGRYDGRIFGNSDVAMVDVLGKVVPSGQLENFMVYFQNDFGQIPGDVNKLVRVAEINKGSRKDAYAIVGKAPDIKIFKIPAGIASTDIGQDVERYEVSELGSEGFVVIFGKGNDAEYVSQTLLPLICHFAAQRMPILDASLVDSVFKMVEGVERELAGLVNSIKAFVDEKDKRIPSEMVGFASKVDIRVRALRTAFGSIRKAIASNYQSGLLMGATMDSVETAATIQEWMAGEISRSESGLFLEGDRDSILRELKHADDQSAGRPGQLMRYLRNLRVTITERYAQLEHVYSGAIKALENSIFESLRDIRDKENGEGVAFLDVAGGMGLANWIKLCEAAGCDGLAASARDLQSVEVNFYLTVYPDIRKRVFSHPVEDVYRCDFAVGGCESPEACYAILRDLADKWAYETRECIEDRNAAREIVFSAIDRFFERTMYSATSDEELRTFVSFYWNEFSAGEQSPLQICKSRIATLRKEFEKLERGA